MAQADYWNDYWEKSDVTIDGDPSLQQGIRYCMFQLHQTYMGKNCALNIGAKSLTGEWHLGLTFWESEVYLMPFYAFTDPPAARSLMMFRYNTLEDARYCAKMMGYNGARFPWTTIRGTDCGSTMRHGMIEMHINAAVPYAIWNYYKLTGDKEFLFNYGLEVMIEQCRFWADRVTWNEQKNAYCICCVTGPDEFRVFVDNNAYTNSMVSLIIQNTLETIALMKSESNEKFASLTSQLKLDNKELETWQHISEKMFIPTDEKLGIILQDETFLNTKRVTREQVPGRPIYHHWYLEKIIRTSVLKQADVLLLLMLRPNLVNREILKKNYEFYEPLTLHDSSLSPCVHSIIASKVNLKEDAWKYFVMTARIDLDDMLKNTDKGLHTANLAGTWHCITSGFAGMETTDDTLSFAPYLPNKWKGFAFKFVYLNSRFKMTVAKDNISIELLSGSPQTIRIYDKDHLVNSKITLSISS